VIEVHLIGYTADLHHVVLDVDAGEERGRYRLVVDGDLFATLDDMRLQRWEQGLDVGGWEPQDAIAELEASADGEVQVELQQFEEPEDSAELADDGWDDAPRGPEADDDDLLLDLTPESAAATAELRDLGLHDDDDEIDGLLQQLGSAETGAIPTVKIVAAPAAVEPEPEPEYEPAVDGEPEDLEEYDAYQESDETSAWDSSDAAQEPAAPVSMEAAPYPPARAAGVGRGRPARAAHDSDVPSTTALPSSSRRRVNPQGLEVPSDAKLTPAQIQAELRAGKSVRLVAKQAGTSEDWVRRWLEPIEAERQRILEQALGMTVSSPKGPSAAPLGRSVTIRLRKRGVKPADATWDAARRPDGTWRLSCKFLDKGKTRTASWLLPRGSNELRAASDLAKELGWVDRKVARTR
jgi:lambda repressor-like predicted transcriptional regulator